MAAARQMRAGPGGCGTTANDLPDTVLCQIMKDAGVFHVTTQTGTTLLHYTPRVCKRWNGLVDHTHRIAFLYDTLRRRDKEGGDKKGGDRQNDGAGEDADVAEANVAEADVAEAGDEEDASFIGMAEGRRLDDVVDDGTFMRRVFQVCEQSPATGTLLIEYHMTKTASSADQLMIAAAREGYAATVHRLAVEHGDRFETQTWIDSVATATYHGRTYVTQLLLALYPGPRTELRWVAPFLTLGYNADTLKLLQGWREMPGDQGFIMHVDDSTWSDTGRDGQVRERSPSAENIMAIPADQLGHTLEIAVANGYAELTRAILLRDPSSATEVDLYSLSAAAARSHHDTVRMILDSIRNPEKTMDVLISAVEEFPEFPDADMIGILVEHAGAQIIEPFVFAELVCQSTVRGVMWSDERSAHWMRTLLHNEFRIMASGSGVFSHACTSIATTLYNAAVQGKLRVLELIMEPPGGSVLDAIVRDGTEGGPNVLPIREPQMYGAAIVRAKSASVRDYLIRMLPPPSL